MPPSTTTLAPVMKPDFSPSSRKATTSATSCGRPTRPAGCWVWSLRLSRVSLPGNPPRAHAIGPNVRPKADGERMRQRHQAALGGGMGFDVRLRHQRARRGDGDNRALGGAQRACGGLGQQKRRRQIDVDHVPPILQRKPPDRPADHDAGVANHRIEPAEALDRRAHGVAHRGLVGDVGLDGHRRARPAAERRRQPGLRQVECRDAPAGVEQMQRDGAADTVGGAGDERDLALDAQVRARAIAIGSRPAGRAGRPTRSRSRRRASSAACRSPRARTRASPRSRPSRSL